MSLKIANLTNAPIEQFAVVIIFYWKISAIECKKKGHVSRFHRKETHFYATIYPPPFWSFKNSFPLVVETEIFYAPTKTYPLLWWTRWREYGMHLRIHHALDSPHVWTSRSTFKATARIWLRYQVCRIRPPLDPIAEWKLHPSSHHILHNFRDVHTTSAHRYYETYPLFSQGQSQLRKISSVYKACNPL